MDDLAPFSMATVAPLCELNRSLAGDKDANGTNFVGQSGGVTCNGRLWPWQILAGGSGDRVKVEAIVCRGRGQAASTGPTTTLDGLALELEIGLQFLVSGQGQQLRLDASQGVGGVVLIGARDPSGKLDEIDCDMFGTAIAQILSANPQTVDVVLASAVNAPRTHEWLRVAEARYIYLAREDGADALAIAAVTEKHGVPLPPTLPPRLVDSERTTFAIARDTFMQKAVMAYLAAHFRPHGKFGFDGATGRVALKQPITLPVMKNPIVDIHPVLDSVTIAPEPGALALHTGLKFVAPTVFARIEIDATATSKLYFCPGPELRFEQREGPHVRLDCKAGGWVGRHILQPILKLCTTFVQDFCQSLLQEFTLQAMPTIAVGDLPVSWPYEDAIIVSPVFDGGFTFEIRQRCTAGIP